MRRTDINFQPKWRRRKNKEGQYGMAFCFVFSEVSLNFPIFAHCKWNAKKEKTLNNPQKLHRRRLRSLLYPLQYCRAGAHRLLCRVVTNVHRISSKKIYFWSYLGNVWQWMNSFWTGHLVLVPVIVRVPMNIAKLLGKWSKLIYLLILEQGQTKPQNRWWFLPTPTPLSQPQKLVSLSHSHPSIRQ